jgi:HSP20 family molecular chaperone IbpA
MTTTNTYTIGRVIPAAGSGYSQLPALFNESWLTNILSDSVFDKAFDVPNATYPYNIVAETDPNGVPVTYYIEVALAGAGKEHINVNVKENKLLISVNKEDAEPDEHVVYFRKGISKRKGQLSFTLKDNTDVKSITSTYTDGLLRVRVPVVQPEVINIDVKVD